MAPGSDERHPQPPSHTGTVPKTKVRNCVVPQEAVTPTRRDINSANLASSSLDWVSVPAPEYNPRPSYQQSSRKATNSRPDHDYSDLDGSISLESALQRFVPVRPQPRGLPLVMQPGSDHGEDSSHNYQQTTANGVNPHANHGAAAVMIVNPTTPNTGNTHPYNAPPNSNRNNLNRSLQSARNTEVAGSNQSLSSQHPSRGPAKANNISSVYEQPSSHRSEASHINGCMSGAPGDTARALGEAFVTSCPDPASVERRLGQIREYIRVTSSLVDTMRNSEDEEVTENVGGCERAAKFCKLLDQLALENVPDLTTNSPVRPTNYRQEGGGPRPMSVQSTGSGYSDNELWQSELKAKMEVSQKRLAALQDQQKRLLKYQAEAKQHLADIQSMSQARQAQDNHLRNSQGADSSLAQNNPYASGQHSHRMYNSNQIGVATTLTHHLHTSGQSDQYRSSLSAEPDSTSHRHGQEDGFSVRSSTTMPHASDSRCSEEENGLARAADAEARWRGGGAGKVAGAARNTYSSDDSGSEDVDSHKGTKSDANMNPLKNDDPFKLMEIAAIKAALQKTKDLMRTVQCYEPPDSGVNEDFQLSHSNVNDNKSEGGQSAGEWSTEGSVCRSIRNAIQPGKVNNHSTNGGGGSGGNSHEASITSLQLLATQLRQEAESIASERQRLQEARNRADGGSGKVSKKKLLRSGSGASSARYTPGPLEIKQIALRAELAEKQRQLEAILHKEKEILGSEMKKMKADACSYSAINQSYNSDQEEGDTDDVMFVAHANSQSDHHHYQNAEGVYDTSHVQATSSNGPTTGQAYYNGSEISRSKGEARAQHSRRNRSTVAERPIHEQVLSPPGNPLQEMPPPPPHLVHHAPQGESNSSSPSLPPPMPPPPQQPAQPAWPNKSNQEPRWVSTHNSQAQSVDRVLSSPVQLPASLPFNMMMPYGMLGGAGCGCWGPWYWQQLATQQRDIHELRQQISNLEERWRAEGSSHTLNNQVPPGNRANNYWDNFRSYSRQNLLSGNSKTNADGHFGSVPVHNPHPLVSRSHNTLNLAPALSPLAPAPAPPAYTPPANTPKRNTNRHNATYEHMTSAPDVLNINQHVDTDHTNRDTFPERNINRPEPIPEIIQSHSNNLNRSSESLNTKKKSSSKLPAKNSANRRNYSLDFVQNTNINIASTSETPNPNLASTSRDKATSKMFDLLRENVYSEVTALISAQENHPDFLIQLFRELQNVSSDSLRQNALQSIRNLSSNMQSESNSHNDTSASASTSHPNEESSSNQANINSLDGTSVVYKNIIDFMIARGEEICTPELLEAFKTVIVDSHKQASQVMPFTSKRLQEFLSRYEGMRLREVSSDIIDDLLTAPPDDHNEEQSLQDIAGCAQGGNLPNVWCEIGAEDLEREGESGVGLDLIECVEYKGDLAEADQTCGSEVEPELLPDVVETEEITPTEAEAEWLGLDRVPTRLHTQDSPANQKD